MQDHNVSLTVGVINGSITASFVYSHPIGGVDFTNLIISEKRITSPSQFLVEVSRLANLNLCRIQVVDVQSYICNYVHA